MNILGVKNPLQRVNGHAEKLAKFFFIINVIAINDDY
jgi:hypothetical protein